MTGEAIHLAPQAVEIVAMRRAADLIRDGYGQGGTWEMIPQVDEATADAVHEHLAVLAKTLESDARRIAEILGIDYADLIWRVS